MLGRLHMVMVLALFGVRFLPKCQLLPEGDKITRGEIWVGFKINGDKNKYSIQEFGGLIKSNKALNEK